MPQDPKQTAPTELPDTATNYERAKPEKQSPGGKLDQPTPPPARQPDELARNGQPTSPKKVVGE